MKNLSLETQDSYLPAEKCYMMSGKMRMKSRDQVLVVLLCALGKLVDLIEPQFLHFEMW